MIGNVILECLSVDRRTVGYRLVIALRARLGRIVSPFEIEEAIDRMNDNEAVGRKPGAYVIVSLADGRHGDKAHLLVQCTMPEYRHYQLTALGERERRKCVALRRVHSLLRRDTSARKPGAAR